MTLPLTEKRKKDREQYHANKERRRELRLTQSREWAAKNRERKRELNRKWKLANPKRTKEIAAKYRENDERRKAAKERTARWRKDNPDRKTASLRKWREENPQWRAEWLKQHPDHHRVTQHNRRARKRAAGGKMSQSDVDQILRSQKWKCAYCRVKLTRKTLHLDHIVALAKGGSNYPSNHQATCSPCNLRKQARDPIEFAQSLGMLL